MEKVKRWTNPVTITITLMEQHSAALEHLCFILPIIIMMQNVQIGIGFMVTFSGQLFSIQPPVIKGSTFRIGHHFWIAYSTQCGSYMAAEAYVVSGYVALSSVILFILQLPVLKVSQ